MRRTGNRTITVDKSELIAKIKENKENHIKGYKKAITAYRKEALRQLSDLTNKVKEGDMAVRLNLTTPIDNSNNYDKIIEMFEWDVNSEVELEQNEFNEYVQDETTFAQQALMSNTMYLG